ncbi:MAG: hypothetical protein IJ680_01955 [Paludibacteraceae bacterium]|nr:hypothetical protein [Paludibacteraceae bacterium]
MITKQDIFDSVEMYDAETLIRFIEDDIFTYDELVNETRGYLSVSVMEKIADEMQNREEREWNRLADSLRVEDYERFKRNFPESKHLQEVDIKLQEIRMNAEKAIRKQAEEQAWKDVDKTNEGSIRKFLEEHPNSPFEQEANQALGVLAEYSMRQEWGAVDHDIEDAVRDFIKKYEAQGGAVVEEAQKCLNDILKERFLGVGRDALRLRIENKAAENNAARWDEIYDMLISHLKRHYIDKQDLLKMIAEDKNLLNASIIRKLLEVGLLGYNDFESMEVSPDFVTYMLQDVKPMGFGISEPLYQIHRMSTEIYFWGIPSSGKTCALGGILSAAGNARGSVASVLMDHACQGYGYMTRLSNLFQHGKVGVLPEGTATTATYEMGFDLVDAKGRMHPITFVDMAGELVRIMYKSDAGELLQDEEVETLEVLTNLLVNNRTKGRKMHFFVLEYGAEERLYDGLPQKTYLEGAMGYIRNTGIFHSDTDAIYLLVTKSDKLKATSQENLNMRLSEYISNNYRGFYNALDTICRKEEINNGIVEVVPFTLGEVCFRNYCRFFDTTSVNVLNLILDKTTSFKTIK